VGNLKERNHLEHVRVLKRTFKETGRCNMDCIYLAQDMDCIYLAQDMDKWRGLVKMVTNFWVT